MRVLALLLTVGHVLGAELLHRPITEAYLNRFSLREDRMAVMATPDYRAPYFLDSRNLELCDKEFDKCMAADVFLKQRGGNYDGLLYHTHEIVDNIRRDTFRGTYLSDREITVDIVAYQSEKSEFLDPVDIDIFKVSHTTANDLIMSYASVSLN